MVFWILTQDGTIQRYNHTQKFLKITVVAPPNFFWNYSIFVNRLQLLWDLVCHGPRLGELPFLFHLSGIQWIIIMPPIGVNVMIFHHLPGVLYAWKNPSTQSTQVAGGVPSPLQPDFSKFPLFPPYGCFLKWWYPPNTPKWSFLVGNPHICQQKPNLQFPPRRVHDTHVVGLTPGRTSMAKSSPAPAKFSTGWALA